MPGCPGTCLAKIGQNDDHFFLGGGFGGSFQLNQNQSTSRRPLTAGSISPTPVVVAPSAVLPAPNRSVSPVFRGCFAPPHPSPPPPPFHYHHHHHNQHRHHLQYFKQPNAEYLPLASLPPAIRAISPALRSVSPAPPSLPPPALRSASPAPRSGSAAVRSASPVPVASGVVLREALVPGNAAHGSIQLPSNPPF